MLEEIRQAQAGLAQICRRPNRGLDLFGRPVDVVVSRAVREPLQSSHCENPSSAERRCRDRGTKLNHPDFSSTSKPDTVVSNVLPQLDQPAGQIFNLPYRVKPVHLIEISVEVRSSSRLSHSLNHRLKIGNTTNIRTITIKAALIKPLRRSAPTTGTE
jgi:hypothetical protein